MVPPQPRPQRRRLIVDAIQTRVFKPGDDLSAFVIESFREQKIVDGSVLAVTSKIVSLAENRVVAHDAIAKPDLVKRESDVYLGEIGYGCHLTVKHGLFIPSAGIDESNSETGAYILYPVDPFDSCRRLWSDLRRAWKLDRLGIVMTDSHTTPLRRGVTGISLAHWGFRGLRNFIGHRDLFGRPLQVTSVNVADGLAAAATFAMGEADECQPLALMLDDSIEFAAEIDPSEVSIPLKDDLFYPILSPLVGG